METIVLFHSRGDEPCQGVAFTYNGPIETGETALAKNVVMPDGSTPIDGDDIRCGSCGKLVDLSDVAPKEGFSWEK